MGRLLFGVTLITLGLVFLSDQLGYADAREVISRWWPAAIIVVGASQLIARPRPWLGAGLVIAIGAILLLTRLEVLPEDRSALIWPVVLVVIGVWLVVSRRGLAQTSGSDENMNVVALFGEQRAVGSATAFASANVNAFFGGATLDLTDAAPVAPGAEVAAAGVFGGVEIIVPRGWDVRVSGLPIFGGIEDNTQHGTAVAGAPRLTVKGLAIFGGVEVKHGEPAPSLVRPQPQGEV
jgi:hypothetical protein